LSTQKAAISVVHSGSHFGCPLWQPFRLSTLAAISN
jgi:hypothetical protein